MPSAAPLGFPPQTRRGPGGRARSRRGLGALLLLVAGLASALPLRAEPPRAGSVLRVGTSGDYAPFSLGRGDGEAPQDATLSGFDVAVARAYARDRGLSLQWVGFRWPRLLAGLAGDHFDLAMSGVTVRPERSAAGRFSVPVVETGAVALVSGDGRLRGPTDLERPGTRIAVNAGGHLERVARRHFPQATLIAVSENRAVLPALLQGAADAAVTDTLEARLWLAEGPGLRVVGPFTRDRKAYLVAPARADLAADLDAWLLEREADGGLARLRTLHLGAADLVATATPLAALLAAVDERLSLMPRVGAAKRRQGHPILAPARETRVVEAALAAVARAAAERGQPPPPEAAVRAFFRAQIEAARDVQRISTRRGEIPPDEPIPSLEQVLRPALLRIGERIARLLVRLPPGLDRATARAAAVRDLRQPQLRAEQRIRIADAIAALAAPAPAPSR